MIHIFDVNHKGILMLYKEHIPSPFPNIRNVVIKQPIGKDESVIT